MASLNEIRKRIKIVESTSKITNAMKLVATAKLKKQKNLFENQQEFFKNFYNIFSYVKSNLANYKYCIERTNGTKNIWIVIFSSMGLCGSFNLNLVKELKEKIEPQDEIILIGKKGRNLLSSKNIKNKIISSFEIDDKEMSFDLYYLIISNLITEYEKNNNIKSIKLLYTKFINSLSFVPTSYNLLPLSKNIDENRLAKPSQESVYTIQPCEETVIDQLLNGFLASCLFGGVLESKVCENASRRNAMDSATKNADDLMKNYKLEFNRKRQADITQEITEIVSGSNVGE